MPQDEDDVVVDRRRGFAEHQRRQAAAGQVRGRAAYPGEIKEGGEEIDVLRQRIGGGGGRNAARPAEDQRHLDVLVVDERPLALQLVGAGHLAVVGEKDRQRVVRLAAGVKRRQHARDLGVDPLGQVQIEIAVAAPQCLRLIRRHPHHTTPEALVLCLDARLAGEVVDMIVGQPAALGAVVGRHGAAEEHDVVRVDERAGVSR